MDDIIVYISLCVSYPYGCMMPLFICMGHELIWIGYEAIRVLKSLSRKVIMQVLFPAAFIVQQLLLRYSQTREPGEAGSQVWIRVYMIAPVSPQLTPSQEIWPSEIEHQFSFKTNMAENADVEGRWVFARI